MELLNIECLGKKLRLEGSMAGWQQLYWDNQLVSQVAASANEHGQIEHVFELAMQRAPLAQQVPQQPHSSTELPADVSPQKITVKLQAKVQWQPFMLQYQLYVADELVTSGERNTQDIERQIPELPPEKPQKFSLIGMASLGFKLLKSAKVVKALLAGASVAAYSWLFSLEFALALIACLMFHEYGHIRAMKYFGMKTKGIYLIPFMGGSHSVTSALIPAGKMW